MFDSIQKFTILKFIGDIVYFLKYSKYRLIKHFMIEPIKIYKGRTT